MTKILTHGKTTRFRVIVLGFLLTLAFTTTNIVQANQEPYGSGIKLSDEYAVATEWASDEYVATIFQDGTVRYFTAAGGTTGVSVDFESIKLGDVASTAFDARGTVFAAIFQDYDGKDNHSVAVVDVQNIATPSFAKYGIWFQDWEGDFPRQVILDPSGPRFAVLMSISGQIIMYEYDFDKMPNAISQVAKTTRNFTIPHARPVFRLDGKIYHASSRSIYLLRKDGSELVIEQETVYNQLLSFSFITCMAVERASPYTAAIVVDDTTYSLPYFVTTGGDNGTILEGPTRKGVVVGVLGPIGRAIAEERVDVCETSDDGRYIAFGSSVVQGFDTSDSPPTKEFESPFANNDPGEELDVNFVSVKFAPSGDLFGVVSVTLKEGKAPVTYIASYEMADEGTNPPSGPTTAPGSLTPIPSSGPNGDDVCFPADAMVSMCDSSMRRMDQVEIGDCVIVNAYGEHSEVYMWGHHTANRRSEFVRIDFITPMNSKSSQLKLSANHYLYVNDEKRMVVSGQVRIGDKLHLYGGNWATVSNVEQISDMGLYHPHTLHGDLIVDGVHVSTFSSILPPRFQHGALAVFRWMYWATSNGKSMWYQVCAGVFDEGSVVRPYLLRALRLLS